MFLYDDTISTNHNLEKEVGIVDESNLSNDFLYMCESLTEAKRRLIKEAILKEYCLEETV